MKTDDAGRQQRAPRLVGMRAGAGLLLAIVSFSGAQSQGPADGASEFVVLFEYSRSRLTPSGRQTVRSAAARIGTEAPGRVQVVGHADQAGDPEYNLRLSQARTRTVVTELTRQGVSPSVIVADWRGEFEPAFPTEDQSQDPRNRRVTIRF